jgi:hypothetical protein
VYTISSYDNIIGRDLIKELKLVLDVDTQCITWDVIDQPMKNTGGGLQKETTHYEDLYSTLMALASTLFQDYYAKASEPEHVDAANKRQTHILDASYEAADLKEIIKSISTLNEIERNKLLQLLRNYELLNYSHSRNLRCAPARTHVQIQTPREPPN